MTKEQDNFLRICLLLFENATQVLALFLDQCIKRQYLSLQSFLNNKHHEIYHMCFSKRCCKCLNSTPNVSDRYLSVEQFKVFFDPSISPAANHTKYCCSTVKPGVSTDDLDISLMNSLLLNFFADCFWDFLPSLTPHDFELFLNSNKHVIFHVCEHSNCCMCTNGNAMINEKPKLSEHTLNKLYRTNGSHCSTCSNGGNANSIRRPCSSVAIQNMIPTKLDKREIRVLQQNFSECRIVITRLVDIRNTVIAHATSTYMSDAIFASVKDQLIEALLPIAKECGNLQNTESLIEHTMQQPLDYQRQKQYDSMLFEHADRELDLKSVVLEFTDICSDGLARQEAKLESIEDKLRKGEGEKNRNIFYLEYRNDPVLFTTQQFLTLTNTESNRLCEPGTKYNIIPARYDECTVFMSSFREGWMRFRTLKEKFIEFAFEKGVKSEGGKQFFHIRSVQFPNYYMTMGLFGWWVRAKYYESKPTDDDATWDIRCLESNDPNGSIPSNYFLVPKRSNEFVCVDMTGRLKGSCRILDSSTRFIIKRID